MNNMDDFHYFLRSRRSIRHFNSNPVPADVIQRIPETATFAPSAHNLQHWRFVVLTDHSVKSRLAEALVSKFQKDMINEGKNEAPETPTRAPIKEITKYL